MEAVMFMADVVCIILLVFAVARASRGSGKPTLGLFAFKDMEDAKAGRRKSVAAGREGHDA